MLKRFLNLFSGIGVFILMGIFVGFWFYGIEETITYFKGSSPEEKVAEDEEIKANYDKMFRNIAVNKYREIALLQSIKYGVDEKGVLDMVVEEHGTNELTAVVIANEEDVLDILRNSTRGLTKEKIEAYSQKYIIPPATVAAIFLDLKALDCPERAYYDDMVDEGIYDDMYSGH